MKTHLLKSIGLLLFLSLTITAVFSQNDRPVFKEKVGVIPVNPSPHDSIYVAYSYVSSDGCPDYFLKIDSIVEQKIFVNKHPTPNPPGFCIQVIRDFTTRVNLGLLEEGTGIYFADTLISTVNYTCKLNKIGMVVPGIDGCTGRLFVREMSANRPGIVLFALNEEETILKPGDKVRFGAWPLKNNQDQNILCPVAGIVGCYELIEPVNAYSLSGHALAGEDKLLAGRAVLFRKGERKAWAFSTIYNGNFAFANVPQDDYTVYVIPDRAVYRAYLPTFYVDKLRIIEADYLTLDRDTTEIAVLLRTVQSRGGNGRVHGNLYYESDNLRDSVLAEKRSGNSFTNDRRANDVPVMLLNSQDQPVAWTLSDAEGNFEFNNVEYNVYKVVSETPAATAEMVVSVNQYNPDVSADMMLRSPDAATSVENIKQSLLDVFPNPVSDKIFVRMEHADEVYVLNAMGQLLRRKLLKPGLNEVDLSDVNAGVLFVRSSGGSFKVLKK